MFRFKILTIQVIIINISGILVKFLTSLMLEVLRMDEKRMSYRDPGWRLKMKSFLGLDLCYIFIVSVKLTDV